MGTLGTVIIGGGTGFVGSQLTMKLAAAGFKPLVVSRMPGINAMTWSEIKDKELPRDTTAVINVAGQNVLDPLRRWTPGFKQNVIASRVNTTKALAQALQRCSNPPKAFITISGVGYYPPSKSVEYNEDSRPQPTEFFSHLCRDWEEAGDLPQSCQTRRVIIRSGVVLGPQGGMMKTLRLPFLLSLGGVIGSGKQYMPWIHIDDLVNMFLFSIKNDNVVGVLNGVAPQVITNKQFTKAFGKAIGHSTIVPMPEAVVKLMFGKERAIMMLDGQKVIPARTQKLGFKYKFTDIHAACLDVARSW